MLDILELCTFMLSDGKDEYGKDLVPALPLSIDRVMENRPLKSPAPLFTLPYEILSIILSHIDSETLGDFALVNSDCRQLARSRQFHSVHFDYSANARELLLALLMETVLRYQSDTSIGGAIGPCIRRITIATDSDWIKHLHNVELSEKFTALDKSVRDELMAKAAYAYSKYLESIESVISCRATLPHLELLDWEDRVTIQQSFLNALTTSSVQHLKLFRVSVEEEFEVVQPTKSSRWNLQTLNMDIKWDLTQGNAWEAGKSSSPVCASLLRSCSHSLETLVWHTSGFIESYSFEDEPGKVPHFAKLRNLDLGRVAFKDNTIIDALLQPSLVVLDLKYNLNRPMFTEALRKRGRIPTLEVLLFNPEKDSIDAYLEFLKANTQLSKISIFGGHKDDPRELPGNTPEATILPILSSSFQAITSLRLEWKEEVEHIPDAGLAIIASLKTLEQLCLSAGCQLGWRHSWLIDHDSMRKYLSLLPRLKKIAFCRDSYKYKHICSRDLKDAHHRYYTDLYPSQEDLDAAGSEDWGDPAVRTQIWEENHKIRMVREAGKYAGLMPKLEWMFIGGYPMTLTGDSSEEGKRAVPLTGQRDSCRSLLHHMFAWEGISAD